MEFDLEQATYPIGKYNAPEQYMPEMQHEWISAIEALPTWLDPVIENLDQVQLETPYRPGGWNARQVIHHLADSHINAYIRLKLALTEDNPVITPYDENRWALLPDVEIEPVNISITLLHALHRRWGTLLRNLRDEDWERTYFHPEHERNVPIWEMTDLYAWHGRHHMEQIRGLRNRMNWW
ncbi:MAG: putative metal-dependent hydrolase [Chitinophagaceae bacterium]|nr:putative metal-dependent hydrolase [Chitinophagaceae bacterium]MCB9045358.1 putative metal-dependent hydrolase [Chitinophagales bacterium]